MLPVYYSYTEVCMMKYHQIDHLLRIFKNDKQESFEKEELRKVLLDDACQDSINAHFYTHWKKSNRSKMGTDNSSFSKILTNIGLKEKNVAQDEILVLCKNHALVFHQETFKDIAVILERWYGKKLIIMNEELKSGDN